MAKADGQTDGTELLTEMQEMGSEMGALLQQAPDGGRRAFLTGIVGVIGASALSDIVAAQSMDDAACEWLGDQDANGNWLINSAGIEFTDGSTLTSAGGIGSVLNQVASGTVTATGGASPAVEVHLDNVSDKQLLDYFVLVYVDTDPAFDAAYAFNFDYMHDWDDTNGTLDLDLVVNWDTDPGAGNDVALRWEVLN